MTKTIDELIRELKEIANDPLCAINTRTYVNNALDQLEAAQYMQRITKHRHVYDSIIDEKEQTITLRCTICGIPQKGKEVWPL